MLPIKPTHDGVLIDIIDRNVMQKDLGGGKVLHLITDDAFDGPHNAVGSKHPGIRPRWARVLAIGPDVHEDDLKIGDEVLCEALTWSRRFPLGRDGNDVVYLWRIKVTDILGVREEESSAEFVKSWEEKISRLDLTIGHL